VLPPPADDPSRQPRYHSRCYGPWHQVPFSNEEAVISKSSEKPKKVAKKQPQKTLKERRAEKRSKPKAV
jgi:hypothetical protein